MKTRELLETGNECEFLVQDIGKTESMGDGLTRIYLCQQGRPMVPSAGEHCHVPTCYASVRPRVDPARIIERSGPGRDSSRHRVG